MNESGEWRENGFFFTVEYVALFVWWCGVCMGHSTLHVEAQVLVQFGSVSFRLFVFVGMTFDNY